MECHSPSPLYEHLSVGVAADPEILALAAHARRGQPAPNLFFAAVYLLLLQGTEHPVSAFYSSLSEAAAWSEDSYPYFRAFCLEQSEEIIDLITSRLVQTNVIRRCSCLLPAFGLIAQQSHGISSALSLIEIGTSAGLNLLWDRYGYDDGEGRQYGDASSPVQLTCEVRGDLSPPIPPVLPTVAFRVGLDLNAVGNSSELGGKEQLTASLEGVQVLGAPGAEDGSQRHLALGAMHRAGTAADLAADYQGPQAPFGRVVVRWRVRLSHEDKQFLDKAFDASAEFALNRHWVFQEGLAAGQQRPLKLSLGQPALLRLGVGEVLGQAPQLMDLS